MGRRTIPKYNETPAQGPPVRSRSSKLDSFKGNIAGRLEKCPQVTAAVIEQRLRPLGYEGGSSILQEYVRKVRPQLKPRRTFVRMKPMAGERFEVDWVTSARSIPRAIRVSCMPSPWSMRTTA